MISPSTHIARFFSTNHIARFHFCRDAGGHTTTSNSKPQPSLPSLLAHNIESTTFFFSPYPFVFISSTVYPLHTFHLTDPWTSCREPPLPSHMRTRIFTVPGALECFIACDAPSPLIIHIGKYFRCLIDVYLPPKRPQTDIRRSAQGGFKKRRRGDPHLLGSVILHVTHPLPLQFISENIFVA